MTVTDSSTAKLNREVLKNTCYLVVIVGKHGLVDRLECPGIPWRLEGLEIGQSLPSTLQALIDAHGDSQHVQLFPYVQLGDETIADVHVLNRENIRQIILQDVSSGHAEEHKLQQKAHEVSLLLEKQAELNRELEEKRAEAEETSQAKSRFIASMSHEFRSPISSIMAYAEYMAGKQPDAAEPAAIQRASWYLLTLVENLLEQARLGEEEVELDMATVDIRGLLTDLRDLFDVQANARGISLEVARSRDARSVKADELRLRQVLVNLLSNAIRYTREGGISLHCERNGAIVEFSVTDSGKGIEDVDIERIFQPFTQVNRAGEGGAGLGLTISRQLVAAMNGELSVRSEVGKGSTFSFALSVPEEDQQDPSRNLEGMCILVVEDDEDIQNMYRIWLEDWGVVVRTARGRERAIAEFEQEPVDLVLADLFLEDGNGIELLTVLRESNPGVATVLCSGSESIGAYYGGDGSVIDCFISKPVSARRLEAALQSALRSGTKV